MDRASHWSTPGLKTSPASGKERETKKDKENETSEGQKKKTIKNKKQQRNREKENTKEGVGLKVNSTRLKTVKTVGT